MKSFLLIIGSIFIFTGCSIISGPQIEEEKPKEPTDKTVKIHKEIQQFDQFSKGNFKPLSWEDIPTFEQDDLILALQVFQKDCEKSFRKKLLNEVCEKAKTATEPDKFFTSNFYPYSLVSNSGEDVGLITGYFEPILQGNWIKTDRFQYAVYNTPSNLITVDNSEFPKLNGMKIRGKVIGNRLVRYTERKDIEKEDLTPICYVDDKIDLFFMHIQGSGKVQMQDGEIINVNYDSQNGRGYYAIGRKLIEDNIIDREDMSLKAIQKWLKDNPDKADDLLNLNKSYVFFKQSEQGATGALGTELVAQRNLAIDKRYIPLGLPVYIQTTHPQTDEPLNHLMVAADVGGAIKGEIRADFYWGTGETAGEIAGQMKEQGKLIVLLPKGYIDAYNE